MSVLIVAPRDDAHANLVEARLRSKGELVERLDVADFPAAALSVRVGEKHKGRIDAPELVAGTSLRDVETVWYRRVGWPRVDERLPVGERAFAYSETNAALMGLAEILDENVFAVNPLQSALMTERGAGKLRQLELAVRNGLAIPRTLATNRPDEAAAFVRSCREGAIYKPFLAPVVKSLEDGRKRTVFTNKLDEAALASLEGVRQAPCLFQELVPKRFDVRVTIMGDVVFPVAIHSQEREGSRIDFRRDYALGSTKYDVITIDRATEAALTKLMRDLGLRFGCVDLVANDDGFVFLEVNQQGQWLWLEEQTGLPLLENFARFLADAPGEHGRFTPVFRLGEPGPFKA